MDVRTIWTGDGRLFNLLFIRWCPDRICPSRRAFEHVQAVMCIIHWTHTGEYQPPLPRRCRHSRLFQRCLAKVITWYKSGRFKIAIPRDLHLFVFIRD